MRPTKNQMEDLIMEIKLRAKNNQRTLVTTLTKRMAEDLAEFLARNEVRVRYMHSEIEGLERTELIRQLRLGEFDALVRSEEHTSELQSRGHLVCRLLLEKKKFPSAPCVR